MLNPDVIPNKEFEQSVLGGYRRDEVDAFLDELEVDYRALYLENAELVEKLKVCLAKIEDYKKDEEFLKTAIINAQKLNETTLKEIELREKEVEVSSKATAAKIIAAAEEQAQAILKKAEVESADAVRAAREQCHAEIEAEQNKANEEIARIQGETAAEQSKLDHLRAQVAEFKNTIIELYKAHLTSISKLPDFKGEEKPAVQEKKIEEQKPVAEETAEPAPVAEPVVAEPKMEEPVIEKDSDETPDGNTMEFKLSEKAEKKEEPIEAPKQLKFENLKFGVDYDINKDE